MADRRMARRRGGRNLGLSQIIGNLGRPSAVAVLAWPLVRLAAPPLTVATHDKSTLAPPRPLLRGG